MFMFDLHHDLDLENAKQYYILKVITKGHISKQKIFGKTFPLLHDII